MLTSHDDTSIPCLSISDIEDAWLNPESAFFPFLREADTILINEAQFFNNLKNVVLDMVEVYYKSVVISGLDGDFKRNIFGEVLSLIPYCDSVEKLSSLCSKCNNGNLGIFSHRISGENEQVIIGSDNYMPLCRNCYNTYNYI